MEIWQPADRVQKNEQTGEFRALVNGTWIPAAKAQKNEETGEYRVVIEAPSGFKRGLRDPIDAAAQLTTNMLPDAIVQPLNRLNNWLAKKTGFVGELPEGGVDQQVREQEQTYQAQRKASGEEGFDWGRVAGNVVNPTNLAVASKIPQGATLIGKLGYGTAAGTGFGLLQPATAENPENFASEKAMQGLMGGVFGLGTAAAMQAGSWAWNQLKATKGMTTPEGRKKIVEEAIRRWSGKDKGQIINALDDPRNYDNVPGSPVTSGDVIASGNLRTLDSNDPRMFGRTVVAAENALGKSKDVTSDLSSDAVKQQVARERALEGIAGTDDAYKAAAKARETTTAPYWKAVESSAKQVDVTPVYQKASDILKKNANEDAVSGPVKDILRKLVIQNPDGSWALQNNPQTLASLSQDIKNKMAQTVEGKNVYNVKVLNEIKTLLDDAIGNAEPAYKQARSIYKEMSKPINRMDVGRELKNRLVAPTGTESRGVFLRAVDDAAKTIKKSTGFSRYDKLSDVLSPEEVKTVMKVANELEREVKKSELVKKSVGFNPAKAAEEGMVELPRVLEQNLVVANYFLGKMKEQVIPEMNQIAADILRDPKRLNEVLKYVPKQRVAEVVKKMNEAAGVSRMQLPAFSSATEQRKK